MSRARRMRPQALSRFATLPRCSRPGSSSKVELCGTGCLSENQARRPRDPSHCIGHLVGVRHNCALRTGADDASRPFSGRELLARVRVAVRRSLRTRARDAFAFDDVNVDFRNMQLRREGSVVVPLTPQAFKILKFMVQNAERVISRDELLNEVTSVSGSHRSADAILTARLAELRKYVMFVLDEMVRKGDPQPGDMGIMVGLGPGMAAELALLRW